eukprot:6161416-Karenia_brevis.AAC.1
MKTELSRKGFLDQQNLRERKESNEEHGAPESKRRRTQEEKDWYDDFWTDADRTSRDIDSVER